MWIHLKFAKDAVVVAYLNFISLNLIRFQPGDLEDLFCLFVLLFSFILSSFLGVTLNDVTSRPGRQSRPLFTVCCPPAPWQLAARCHQVGLRCGTHTPAACTTQRGHSSLSDQTHSRRVTVTGRSRVFVRVGVWRRVGGKEGLSFEKVWSIKYQNLSSVTRSTAAPSDLVHLLNVGYFVFVGVPLKSVTLQRQWSSLPSPRPAGKTSSSTRPSYCLSSIVFSRREASSKNHSIYWLVKSLKSVDVLCGWHKAQYFIVLILNSLTLSPSRSLSSCICICSAAQLPSAQWHFCFFGLSPGAGS